MSGRLQARNTLLKVPNFATIKRAVKCQKVTWRACAPGSNYTFRSGGRAFSLHLGDTSRLYLSESLKAVRFITGLM
jgi:hypothetical protein